MWSRQFVVVGLASSAMFAALAIIVFWFVLFSLGLRLDLIGGVLLNVTAYSAGVGTVIYPSCWFMMIQRGRDYSISRTFKLLRVNFGVSCLGIFAILFLAFFCLGVLSLLTSLIGSAKPETSEFATRAVQMLLGAPFMAATVVAIGAFVAIIPNGAIATPIAFLHRWLLLTVFAQGGGAATPVIRSNG
jgi:hypothetical protein